MRPKITSGDVNYPAHTDDCGLKITTGDGNGPKFRAARILMARRWDQNPDSHRRVQLDIGDVDLSLGVELSDVARMSSILLITRTVWCAFSLRKLQAGAQVYRCTGTQVYRYSNR